MNKMGKKRKHEDSEEELRLKIRKLEEQLARTTNQSRNSSPDESLNYLPLDTPPSGTLYCETPLMDLLDTIQYETQPSGSPRRASPRPASASGSILPAPSPQPQPGTSEELELDEDILQLLGDAPKAETCLGPSIHKDVARRWQDILAKGLPKDIKENLLKEYLVPSNCDFLIAPALNLEVKAALPDALVKRDTSLLYKQKQLGIALSALSTVTEMVISNETSKQKLLKPLSDACRILCDSHYSETKTRRKFVISSINTKLKDTLVESGRDKLLFGENVSEKLKVAKTIQQSGDALKNASRQKPQRQNASNNSNNKNRLNYVPQHRKTDVKPHEGRRAINPVQRQVQSSTRKMPERLLPARSQTTHRQ